MRLKNNYNMRRPWLKKHAESCPNIQNATKYKIKQQNMNQNHPRLDPGSGPRPGPARALDPGGDFGLYFVLFNWIWRKVAPCKLLRPFVCWLVWASQNRSIATSTQFFRTDEKKSDENHSTDKFWANHFWKILTLIWWSGNTNKKKKNPGFQVFGPRGQGRGPKHLITWCWG